MTLLARAGLVARGIIYVIVGWIALEIAFGSSGRQADQAGAVRVVAANRFGSVALWLLVAGFCGLVLWRASEALNGAAGPGGDKATTRLAALARALLYGFVVYGLLKYAIGLGAPASSDKQAIDLTSTAMREPGGRILVGLAGLALLALGAALAYRAWEKDFVKQLKIGEMRPRVRKVVVMLGQAGGMARGTVFAAAGIFILVAALRARPGQAKGVDATLRALATTPAGPWLLAVIAVGLVIFGIYSCAEARWRRV
jgi:hypothetical protein